MTEKAPKTLEEMITSEPVIKGRKPKAKAVPVVIEPVVEPVVNSPEVKAPMLPPVAEPVGTPVVAEPNEARKAKGLYD